MEKKRKLKDKAAANFDKESAAHQSVFRFYNIASAEQLIVALYLKILKSR